MEVGVKEDWPLLESSSILSTQARNVEYQHPELTVAELEGLESSDQGSRAVLLRQSGKNWIGRTASVVDQHQLGVGGAVHGDQVADEDLVRGLLQKKEHEHEVLNLGP